MGRTGNYDTKIEEWVSDHWVAMAIGVRLPSDISGDPTVTPTEQGQEGQGEGVAPTGNAGIQDDEKDNDAPPQQEEAGGDIAERAAGADEETNAGAEAKDVGEDECAIARMAQGPLQAVPALGRSMRRAGAHLLRIFAEVDKTEGPGGYKPKDVDIWFFPNASMNRVAMSYNRRSTSYGGATWVYNDTNRRRTAIMISAQATPRLKIQCSSPATPPSSLLTGTQRRKAS